MTVQERILNFGLSKQEIFTAVSPDGTQRQKLCTHSFLFESEVASLLKATPDLGDWIVEE